jgi:CRISPR-associated endonuclease Csn1
MNQKNFLISYDIGYASIGWSIMNSADSSRQDPDILGCGVVTFPTDDCLASTRRNLRRTRRNIRATRMRIDRLKKYLSHIGFLSRKELDADGHPAPFFLAARALLGEQQLTALELWQVLRFYAHNRGYDGNTRWANAIENDDEDGNEDTEKLANAYNLMKKFEKQTMAETICAVLELDPTKSTATFTEKNPAYKTQNAAFPRNAVLNEVTLILAKHQHLLSLAHAAHLMQDDLTLEQRDNLSKAGIKLPKRYMGGLLFGQLVPRFDNRIIARCPITWAKLYDQVMEKENDEEKARHVADRDAKVPVKNCPEFYRYRWARLLANIKVDGKSLDAKCRTELTSLAEASGGLSKKEIEKYLKECLGKQIVTNLEAYFNLHPDSEDALVFDPAIKFAHSNAQGMQHFWPLLPDNVKKLSVSRWRKGKSISPSEWIERMSLMNLDTSSIDAAIKTVDKAQKEKKGKPHKSCLNKAIKPKLPSGRAAYSRTVLKQVFEEVMAGYDPTKPAGKTSASDGENKPQDGILYGLLAPGSRVRELESQRSLDSLTNNHLVRHRLLILERLTQDIIKQYTGNQPEKVTQVIVEVARELKEFSGSTAKEISSELNSRLKNFKSAVKHLEDNGISRDMINGSLIRKCRIAMDLGWTCPFTNQKYDVTDLTKLEREHIIPYSARATNALHALVLTFPEVNRMKGKRTARQFIQEHEGQTVPNTNLSIMTLKQYDSFVDKLSTKGHPDDSKRMKARKALLATAEFDEKEQGFTEGHLTQSSHLIKLASRQLRPVLPSATINHIPGIVNAEIRKAWRLTSTLALACPDVIDADGNAKPKDEIRNITHLHHALDAAVLGLCAHYIPLTQRGQDVKGKIWQAMLKRNKSEDEKRFLLSLRCFKSFPKDQGRSQGHDVRLMDLAAEVKNSLARKLAECRVVQHLPSDRSGARTELTTWRVLGFKGEGDTAEIALRQYSTTVEEGKRIKTRKDTTEKAGKLLGPRPIGGKGKLNDIKGAIVIAQNYGVALDPEPTIIPFHKVHWRVYDKSNPASLINHNSGKVPRILRNGMIISVKQGTWRGVWKIKSVKSTQAYGLSLDLSRPESLKLGKGNAPVSRLLEDGLELMSPDLTCTFI